MAQDKKEKAIDPSYISVFQSGSQKMVVPGLTAIYKVWDTFCTFEDKYHYLLLEFQTKEQALAFQKNCPKIKQKNDAVVFKLLENCSASGHVILRSEFEISRMRFNISNTIQVMSGEGVFSEFNKAISLENVEQKYCAYNSVALISTTFNTTKQKVDYEIMEEDELLKYKQKFNFCTVGCSPSSW